MKKAKLRKEIRTVPERDALGKASDPGGRLWVSAGINPRHPRAPGSRPREDANPPQRAEQIWELFRSIVQTVAELRTGRWD